MQLSDIELNQRVATNFKQFSPHFPLSPISNRNFKMPEMQPSPSSKNICQHHIASPIKHKLNVNQSLKKFINPEKSPSGNDKILVMQKN